jgi:hypothetical protein
VEFTVRSNKVPESIYAKALKIIEDREEAGKEPSSEIEEAVKTLALTKNSVEDQIASLLG